jgi:putative peptidoglycan lipid II flippase
VIPVAGAAAPATGHGEGSAGVGRRLAGATAIVGAAFIVSRVLGQLREIVIAAQFGTSPDYAVYVQSFRLPDTLFLLIISGVVGSAYIPVFTELMAKGKEGAAWRLTSTMINASVIVLALSGLALALIAPQLVAWIIAPGWDATLQARVVDLTRVLMLSPLFLGLGGWAQGVLNARDHFTLPALAPIAYNCCIILGALLFVPIWGLPGLVYGVVLGALLHFLVQVPGLVAVGMRYSPGRINLHDEGVREVSRLMGPRLIGQGAYQANIIAIGAIGTNMLPERLSAFNYAYLLMLLPFGVVALSLATVIFPTMAAQFGRGALDDLKRTLAGALRLVVFLIVPAALGLGLLRTPIVTLLFQFGAFNGGSTALVSDALGWFAWGLLGYCVLEILTRGYYAMQDTRTPVLLALGSMAITIALAGIAVFVLHADHTGLAFSLALATTLEAVALYVILRRRLGGLDDRRVGRSALISLVAATEMGLVLWGALPLLQALTPDGGSGKLGSLIIVGGGVLLGAGVYLGVARLLRAEELDMAFDLVRRRVGR